MSCICIVTALPAESRVFIDSLKLRQLQTHGIRLYGCEHYLLLQTGIGKLKASACTAALLHTRPDISLLINAGIAGGAAAIGSVHLAHRIVDSSTGANWFPHLPPPRHVMNIPTTDVHTVDQPCSDYRDDAVYDMEASGVLSAASAYLSTDAIQSIKVVSDNSHSTLNNLGASNCQELMELALPPITQLCQWQLSRTAAQLTHPELDSLLSSVTARVHHTATEQLQLHRQLQQLLSLTQELPEPELLVSLKSAREIKTHLRGELASTPLHYSSNT